MKKVAIILGYLAAICIALFAWFKIGHYPGANYLVGVGCALFCLGFAPAFAWIRYKGATSGLNKVISVVSFLTMFFLGVSIAAKAMHWGCGVANACIGYTFLILLILLVIGQAVKERDAWKSLSLHAFSILAALVLTLITFSELTTIPRHTIYDFTCVIDTQNKEIKYFTDKSNSFFENFDKNAPNADAKGYFEKASQVNAQCDSMIAFIKKTGEEMMFTADKKQIAFDSIQNLCHADFVQSENESSADKAKDSIFMVKYEEFRTFMSENTNSRGKEVLDMFFPTLQKDSTQDCSTSNGSCCCCCNLLCQLIDLNANILHIRILQAETMNYLQTMQAKALTKGTKPEE